MSPPNKRSVRFIESTSTNDGQQPPQKRSRPVDVDNMERAAPGPSVLRPSSHKVKGKRDRVNEDELDDVDDWNARDDGDPDQDGNGANLPSQSELIEAKRKRREQRGGIFDDDDTMDETEASLAKEGVKIEPFHMREEETDGTGYFDGDTYVFRKHVPTQDGEADAWADTLMQDGDNDENGPTISIARKRAQTKESSTRQEDMDDLSKEELYKRIVPLLGDSMESIMEAIRRYGKLAKTKSNSKNRRKQQQPPKQPEPNDNKEVNIAKSHLDDLTGAANALLLKGEVDIYDRTRQDILRMFPSLAERQPGTTVHADTKPSPKPSKPKWEYQGNEDHQLHGPYTTEQMIAWVQSGYFVGAQRVKIRTVCVQEPPAEEETVEPQLSTEEDLMADLMDDDEEEEEESRPSKKAKESGSTITVKGEWMWSNEVDYRKYL